MKTTTMRMLKFKIEPIVKMPAGATLMKTAIDPATGAVSCWALCPDPKKVEKRFFLMAKTGEELPPEVADCFFLESVISLHKGEDGQLKVHVTHVWEVPRYLATDAGGF